MPEGEGELQPIRPETLQRIQFADRILTGDYDLPSPESLDPEETFSGPILDLNDPNVSLQEAEFVMDWIQRQMKMPLKDVPIVSKYTSPDLKTKFEIYEPELGIEKWKISKWQNEGEKPFYIFWPQDTYEWQEEMGYRKISSEA